MLPTPYSFLWRKWKDLCVGDLVCLHKDNIVPVSCCPPGSDSPLPGEGCLPCPSPAHTPSPSAVSSLLPSSSHPRPMCSCWPARSPAVCATWKQQTSTGEHRSSLGAGAWASGPSPVATQCGSQPTGVYLGHSSWEHLWGTCKCQGQSHLIRERDPPSLHQHFWRPHCASGAAVQPEKAWGPA